MRIAGKNLPWWWLVLASLVVIGLVVAAATALRQPGQQPNSGLPPTAEKPGVDASPTAGTPGSGGQKSNPASAAPVPVGNASNGSGSGDSTDDNGSSGGTDGEQSGPSVKKGYVIIKFWNDTAAEPPMKVVISADGASWKPNLAERSDVGKLGPVTLNKQIALTIYPDGPSGKAIQVPIKLDTVMDSNDVDAVHVEVRDDGLRVLGNPVVDVEVTASRR